MLFAPSEPQLHPMPRDSADAARWRHTALRRRLLDGRFEDDIRQRVIDRVGPTRHDAWHSTDISSNPFRSICTELSTLYLREPVIRHDDEGADPGALDGLRGAVRLSGLWSSMQRFQAWVVGCREYLQAVTCDDAGVLRYRPVAPDHVVAYSTSETPDIPSRIEELRLRHVNGKQAWVWEIWDVFAPDYPEHYVLRATAMGDGYGDDLTAAIYGSGASGALYPYFSVQTGLPLLPFVLYHAERLGDRLWSPYDMIEAVEGSLNIGVLNSFLVHIMQTCAHPQRWAANAQPAGTGIAGASDTARAELVTDPASLLILESLNPDNPTIQVGQWNPGADPMEMFQTISAYSGRLAADMGVSSSDLQRASDPRSGYAIALSTEGKRAAQAKYRGPFAAGDSMIAGLTAALLNAKTGSNYPESGYSIYYPQIPLSPSELDARRRHALELRDAGLMSDVEARMYLNPGVTAAQAAADLVAISGVAVDADDAGSVAAAVAGAAGGADQTVEGGASPKASLNGAQVTSAQSIILSVAGGQLPRSTGVQMLSKFFQIEIPDAELIMGSVGGSFSPTETE